MDLASTGIICIDFGALRSVFLRRRPIVYALNIRRRVGVFSARFSPTIDIIVRFDLNILLISKHVGGRESGCMSAHIRVQI